MKEVKNYNGDTVKDLIKDFPIEPMFNKVIITLNKVEREDGLVLQENPLSEIQYVISTGVSSQVTVGQKIILDLDKLTVKLPVKTDQGQVTESIKIDPIFVEDEMFAVINDGQIKAKYK